MQQSNPNTAVPAEQPAIAIRVCKHPDCKKQLRSDNKSGYCTLHADFGRPHRNTGPQICKEPGCTTPLRLKSRTGYCRRHYPKVMTAPQLEGDDLEARRGDDRWEERNGETNTVACRICGIRRERLGPKGRDRGHLFREHELTVPQYHQHCESQGWGTPPIASLKSQKDIAEWKDKHPEKVEGYRLVRLAKRKLLRRTDPNFVKHEGDLIRKRAQRKLTDADKAVRVQCQVPVPSSGLPCGEWYRSLGAHLWGVHNEMSFAAYSLLCPGAPTEAPDLAGQGTKVGEFSKRLWAERKRKEKEAWRPEGWSDWGKWPPDRKMVGLMLIENRQLTNREIGQILDDSRLPCPFGKTWERALTVPGTGANWISSIRKDLGMRVRRSAA